MIMQNDFIKFFGIKIIDNSYCTFVEYTNRLRNNNEEIDTEPNVSDYFYETLKLRLIQTNRYQIDKKIYSLIRRINKLQNRILDIEFNLIEDFSYKQIYEESLKIAEKAAELLKLNVRG